MLNKLTPSVFKTGFLKELLQIEGVVLAGGAIRDTLMEVVPKDYDIFFTKNTAIVAASILLKRNMELIDSTHYTHTYKLDASKYYDQTITVQLIFKQIYTNKFYVITDFDFTNIMLAIDKDGFEIGKKTLEHIESRIVGINVITKPLNSLTRLQKYTNTHDVYDAYHYILSVLKDADPGIVLNANFYDGHIEKKYKRFILRDVRDKVLILNDPHYQVTSENTKQCLEEFRPKGLLGVVVLAGDVDTNILSFEEMESIIRECQANRSSLARLLNTKI
jgi:hypothetical protein